MCYIVLVRDHAKESTNLSEKFISEFRISSKDIREMVCRRRATSAALYFMGVSGVAVIRGCLAGIAPLLGLCPIFCRQGRS